MKLFAKKSPDIIGLELGSSAIKLVQLRIEQKKHQLVTFGMAFHDRSAVRTSALADTAQVQETLTRVLQQARVTTDRVVVSLPAINVFHTTLEIPNMPKKDLASAVQWEAKRTIPLPLEKMSLDWQVIPNASGVHDTLSVILTAAPRTVVDHYVTLIKTTGLSLVGLETEVNALQRSILPRDPGTYLVIDMGASNTNAIVFNNHIPVVVRNISVGADVIVQQIANTLNISAERAAMIQKELGIPSRQASHPAADTIRFVMETQIAKEIQRVIGATTGTVQPTRIILVGGAAHLAHAPEYFTEQLGIPASIGNPWQYVQSHPDLAATLAEHGPECAVAVGLALKTKTPAPIA